MARIRTIKPDMGESKDMAKMGFGARYFFVLLLCHLDDKGRAEWLPKKLAGAMYAHDSEVGVPEMEGWLGECVAATVLVRYEKHGVPYVCAPSFCKHQTINKPVASKCPAPDECTITTVALREHYGSATGVLQEGYGSTTVPEKEREREIGKGKGKLKPTLPANAPLDPPSATDGFAEFWASYPRKDSKQEARKAWAKLSRADRLAAMSRLGPWVASDAAGRDRAEWLRYCPHAATWLRARRWEDDVIHPEERARRDAVVADAAQAEAEAELAKVREARLTPRCPVPMPRPPSPPPPGPEPEDADTLARRKAQMMEALTLTPGPSTVSEPVQQDQECVSGAGRDHRDPHAPRGALSGQSVSLAVVDGGGSSGGL